MNIATTLRISIVPLLFLGAVTVSCREFEASNAPLAKPTLLPAKVPTINTVFTSSREVRVLAPSTNIKEVWAATSGGVLKLDGSNIKAVKSQKWTRAQGLPSNETFGIRLIKSLESPTSSGTVPLVQTPLGNAYLSGQNLPLWTKTETPLTEPVLIWRKKRVKFDLETLYLNGKSVGFPNASSGTHISAVVPETRTLRVSVYGDGFWLFDGKKWTRDLKNIPPINVREITALSPRRLNGELVFGTRRDGVWAGLGRKWRQLSKHQDEPYIANTQFFAEFKGAIFASTLDDGLVYLSGDKWRHVQVPVLSSNAARHLEVFRDQLFVRYGTGVVDSFDGKTWTKDVLKTIPRKGVYAIDSSGNRLICAGWGGFSEWDGQNWTPHFDLPEIKGVPVVGIQCDDDDIWLLTQSRGLMRWSRAENTLTVYDERNGLSDDWITAFARSGDELFAGTFVGGLCHFDGEKWVQFPETKGENITAIAAIEGGIIATSRSGAWRVKNGVIEKVAEKWLEPELQALMKTDGGVWLGGRTSINFWKS